MQVVRGGNKPKRRSVTLPSKVKAGTTSSSVGMKSSKPAADGPTKPTRDKRRRPGLPPKRRRSSELKGKGSGEGGGFCCGSCTCDEGTGEMTPGLVVAAHNRVQAHDVPQTKSKVSPSQPVNRLLIICNEDPWVSPRIRRAGFHSTDKDVWAPRVMVVHCCLNQRWGGRRRIRGMSYQRTGGRPATDGRAPKLEGRSVAFGGLYLICWPPSRPAPCPSPSLSPCLPLRPWGPPLVRGGHSWH